MSEDGIICNNCGNRNKKGDKYCKQCGSLIEPSSPVSLQETQEKLSDTLGTTPIPSDKIVKFHFRDLSAGYKVLAFFIIVALVDLVASFIFVMGYRLPLNTYFMIFVGFFLLFMIIVGLLWAAVVNADFANHLLKGCAAVAGIILLLVIIIVPLYVIFALPGIVVTFSFSSPALEELSAKITDAISNAFNNFISSIFQDIGDSIEASWEEAFADVEVPGFEPFLFIGLFMILLIFIVRSYHLKAKKTNIINSNFIFFL